MYLKKFGNCAKNCSYRDHHRRSVCCWRSE
jgi:hypothetical protein